MSKKNPFQQLATVWGQTHFRDDGGGSTSTVVDKQQAIQRTLPLLEDPTSVPFVCRYRTDIIYPLTTKEIHLLSDMLQRYRSLESLRNRMLETIPTHLLISDNSKLKSRIETSISKSELEDLFAPYKPPPKGSLEDRIRKDPPPACL